MNPVGWPAPVLEMSCSKQTTSWRNWHWESTPCQSQAQSMKPVATHWGSATPHNLQTSFQQLEKKVVLTLQISSVFFHYSHYTLPGTLLPHIAPSFSCGFIVRWLAWWASSTGPRFRARRGIATGQAANGLWCARPRFECRWIRPWSPWWRWGWRPGSKSWPRLGWKMQLWRRPHIHWRIWVV